MAKRSNYFAYNIIDSLYYGRPVTDEDMIKEYGKKFHRRSEWPVLSEDEKNNFDAQEQEFIKTIINKYITDNNTYSYFDYYYNNNQKTDITYAYINPSSKSGIELSDMICNINGMHVYKLLSAKDIDFDNVILPNSQITNDETWGIFDPARRWGNNPIRINNIFELFNVIDYLLCACNNIWNELNKLKYNNNDSVNIWFVVNASNDIMIIEDKKIYKDDFKKENIGLHQVKLLTTLDPSKYYINLNVDDFGIGTNFYKNINDGNDIIFTRSIENKTTKNIELAQINNILVDKVRQTKTTTNINGELVDIYGYSIGNDLKIYPGARIDTIIDNSNIMHEKMSNFEETLIDYKNKKLKYDVFFRPDINNPELFKRVYIEFLYNYNIEEQNLHSTIPHPYILYYIDEDNKKHVLYVHPISSQFATIVNLIGKADDSLEILKDLSTHNDYDISELVVNDGQNIIDKENKFSDIYRFSDKFNVIQISSLLTNNYVPLFYVINDCYSFTFKFITPNTSTFSQTLASITIYYYKKENNITNGNIYLNNDENTNINNYITLEELKESDNIQKIEKTIDTNQLNKISYSLERYNVPEKRDIYFEITASYIANGENDNPFNLLLDDEYYDIPLYKENFDQLSTEDKISRISSYYYFNGFESDDTHKRNFEKYKESNIVTLSDYQLYDAASKPFYHIWEKIENPYHLTYEITYNSTVNNDNLKEEIINEINNISLEQISYNIYHLNHIIEDEDIEQLQYDINFIIDETSKVKRSTYTFPINLNKILDLSINYISDDIKNEELNKYGNYINNTTTYKYEYTRTLLNNIDKLSFKDVLNLYGEKKNYSNNKPIYNDVVRLLNDINDDNLDQYQITTKNNITYDNTITNKTFGIIYDDNKKYINLLGSYYLDSLINNKKNDIYIYSNDNNITENNIINNGTGLKKNNYIFNINGFGFKYRLHGFNNEIVINNNAIINNSIFVNNILRSSFDILSVSTELPNNSIIKKLNFKFTEEIDNQNNSYQLSYISYLYTNNEYIWTKYDNDFKIGNYDKNYNEYTIKTIPFDIIKTSYQVPLYPIHPSSIKDGKISPEAESKKINTYIPLCYMYINSSTFYPPLEILPIGEYNLNNNEDIEKYNNYVSCWDQEDNYHPITVSLLLEENYNNDRPYFAKT